MTKFVQISGQIDAEVAGKLDDMAIKLSRSRDWIVARAVEQYVADELDLVRSLDEADAEIDRGEFFTQEQIESWLAVRSRERTGG